MTVKTCIDCGAEFNASQPNKQVRCHDCQHKRNLEKIRNCARRWHKLHPVRADRPNQGIPRSVVALRNRGYAHTLEETAQMLGTSRQRVQQIERGALLKLRKAFAELGLNSVAEVLG